MDLLVLAHVVILLFLVAAAMAAIMATDLLERELLAGRLDSNILYACGPMSMLARVAQMADQFDLPCQVLLESRMACGVGACLGCALPAIRQDDPSADHYLHVCKDGPIFSPGLIQWQKIQMYRTPPQTFLYS